MILYNDERCFENGLHPECTISTLLIMSIRRLPLREALATLQNGPVLPVKALKLRFVDKNASSGARYIERQQS